MPVSAARGAKKKCDDLFSRIIRSHGTCEKCGESRYEQLQTAHIISRSYSHTRCDIANAFCLCAACHHHFTLHPVIFGVWTIDRIGQLAYDELEERARRRAKMDWGAELERLIAFAALIGVSPSR